MKYCKQSVIILVLILSIFVPMLSGQAQADTNILYGDVNKDGTVDGKDLILLRQSLAGWDVSIDSVASDVNADGNVDGKDLILLRQLLANWDVVLGPKPELPPIVANWVYVKRWDDDTISWYPRATVSASFYTFNADGTGYYYTTTWASWDNDQPLDYWYDIGTGSKVTEFTYTLQDNELIYYIGDSEWPEIKYVSWAEDGSLILTHKYWDNSEDSFIFREMPKDNMTPEELLTLFGLDPNVP